METKTLNTLLGGIAIGAVAGFGISSLMKKKTVITTTSPMPHEITTVKFDGEEESNVLGLVNQNKFKKASLGQPLVDFLTASNILGYTGAKATMIQQQFISKLNALGY